MVKFNIRGRGKRKKIINHETEVHRKNSNGLQNKSIISDGIKHKLTYKTNLHFSRAYGRKNNAAFKHFVMFKAN